MRITAITLLFLLFAVSCAPGERAANFEASGCYKNSRGDVISINGTRFTFITRKRKLYSNLSYNRDKIGYTLTTNPSIVFKIDINFNVVAYISNDTATVIRVSNSTPLSLIVTDVYSGRQISFFYSSCS